MGRAILFIFVAVAVIVGGLLVLRGSARMGTPDADVLERAKQREREQRAKDDD
jgi:hypothetical protein